MSSNLGILYVVATVLGNPGDLSSRARETLSSVDFILAEDTRRSGRLLSELEIKAPPFSSFHEHNEAQKLGKIIEKLKAGKNLALISDAGTPLMSDPGYLLVRACHEEGIKVVPVPGPSAPITALSASGLPPYPFVFLGFLPRKSSEQKKTLSQFRDLSLTLVYFERKDRIKEGLASAYEVLGPREACIARELTKVYEEFILFELENYSSLPDDLLGEISIIIGPPKKNFKNTTEEMLNVLDEEIKAGGKPRQLARRAAERLKGWTSKEIYEYMQEGKNQNKTDE